MHHRLRLFVVLAACLLALGVVPALAQSLAPSAVVAPVWTEADVLTTLDTNGAPYPIWNAGDDYRYVTADIYLNTTVEFYAIQMTCTAPPTLLDGYIVDTTSSTGDPGDDWEQFWANGDEWDNPCWNGDCFGQVYQGHVAATGARTFTITRRGAVHPLGRNGEMTTIRVGSLRYRVRPTTLPVFNAVAPLTCTGVTLLNRDGQVIIAGSYNPPPPLRISNGYSITGTVRYQSRLAGQHAGIGVVCQDNATPTPNQFTTRTDALGRFTIGGLRRQDWYQCRYFGQNVTPENAPAPPVDNPDVYLNGWTFVYLGDAGRASVQLLPVNLVLGNSVRGAPGDDPRNEGIFNDDFADVTANWGTIYPVTVNYGPGDVNNDKRVDRTDLTVVAGSYGRNANYPLGRVLVSAARSGRADWLRDSRIWINTQPLQMAGTDLVQHVAGATLDFWPALSPDGKQLAFVRAIGAGTSPISASNAPMIYALFVANADGTAPRQLTPGINLWNRSMFWTRNADALAPSWSPDGTQIAFVCAQTEGTKDGWRDLHVNRGDICIVDANGRNLRKVSWGAKVFPPAWNDNEFIFYGGSRSDNPCSNTLCFTRASTGTTEVFDADLPPGNNPQVFADMPVLGPYDANGNRILFYRYRDGTNTVLRAASIRPMELWWPWPGDRVEPFNGSPAATLAANEANQWHTIVAFNDGGYQPVSNRVDYIANADPYGSFELVYGTYDSGPGWYYSGNDFFRLPTVDFLGGIVPVWPNPQPDTANYRLSLFNVWGNDWWNGDYSFASDNSGTNMWGNRNTIFRTP